MKIAVVIFTCNAVRRGLWPAVLTAVQTQTLPVALKLVVDSASRDETVKLARQAGWTILHHRRQNFNHGRTRQRVLQILRHRQFDTVIFLSQDVVLADSSALSCLVEFLTRHQLTGVYGRQSGDDIRHSFDAWQRAQCYPATSEVRQNSDLPRPVVFFSDAFAAWQIAPALEMGGFPATNFAEDVLLAAQVFRHGGSIGYCAEARCFHQHSDSLKELFCRGEASGRFHAAHPELLSQFQLRPVRRVGGLPWRLWLPGFCKLLGYAWGRYRGN